MTSKTITERNKALEKANKYKEYVKVEEEEKVEKVEPQSFYILDEVEANKQTRKTRRKVRPEWVSGFLGIFRKYLLRPFQFTGPCVVS